jgi:hypothetical protein
VKDVLGMCTAIEIVVGCSTANVKVGGSKPCATDVVGEEQKFLLQNVETVLLENVQW